MFSSSTSGCPALTPGFASTNATITPPLPGHLGGSSWITIIHFWSADLYDLSYTWYCAIGAFLVITFSLIYTYLISAQVKYFMDAHVFTNNFMILVFFVNLYFWTISKHISSSTFAKPALLTEAVDCWRWKLDCCRTPRKLTRAC